VSIDSPYLALKLAHALFRKSPQALGDEERERLTEVARRQQEIEHRILARGAAAIVLSPASVDACIQSIRERYPDELQFEIELNGVGLSVATLRAAVERDLVVEAVLEEVAARVEPVSDIDAEIFYFQHRDKFRRPETRALRHILVTINETLAGSERSAAFDKIRAIRARLAKEPGRFGEQALKHSECPTAMDGGRLGQVPRGKLFGEVEAVAFELQAGELSDVVESPLGFHVLICDDIQGETTVSFAEARTQVIDHLGQARRVKAQRAWIAELFRSS
jgi:peptidyl-prolyl cis-trans isomerase C